MMLPKFRHGESSVELGENTRTKKNKVFGDQNLKFAELIEFVYQTTRPFISNVIHFLIFLFNLAI